MQYSDQELQSILHMKCLYIYYMKTSLEYQGEVHFLDLSAVGSQQELTNIASKLFSLPPQHLQLRVHSINGPLLNKTKLASIKKSGADVINFFVGQSNRELPKSKLFEENMKQLQRNSEISQESKLYKQKQGSGEVIENLQCDRCFVFPIVGPVYKCLVCANFDLCQPCHHSYHSFHPILEIKTAEQYPTEIRVLFSEHSQAYMQKRLEQQHTAIKKQKIEMFQKEAITIQQIDPSSLSKKEVRKPNFLASLLESSCYCQ